MIDQPRLETKACYQHIREDVLHLWEQAHGNRVRNAYIHSEENYLAIFLPGALSLAELKLTQHKFGKRLLKRYLRELMDWVMANLMTKIEQISGRPVQMYKTYLDPEAGWIMFYFRFGTFTACGS